MGSIPRYQSQQGLPGNAGTSGLSLNLAQAPARMNPSIFTQAGQGYARTGEALAQSMRVLSDVGNRINNLGQRFFEVQQSATEGEQLSGFSAEVDGLVESYKKRDDYQEFEKDYQGKVQELKAKYSEGLVGKWTTDFDVAADSAARRGLAKTRTLAFDRADEHWRGSAVLRRQQLMADTTSAGTTEGRRNSIKQWDELVDEGVRLKFLGREKAAQQKLKFRAEADQALGEQLAEADPDGVLVLLGNKNFLPNLAPAKRTELKKLATTWKERQDKEQKEAQLDNLVADLRGRHGSNYDAMSEELKKPANIRQYGTDGVREAWSTIQAFDKQEQAVADQRKSESAEAELRAFNLAMADKQFAKASAMARRFRFASPEAQRAALESSAKGQTTTNDQAWAKLHVNLYVDKKYPSYDGLVSMGIRPDKMDEALKLVSAERGKALAAGGVDYAQNALDQFKATNGYKSDKEKAAAHRFALSLKAQMKREKMDAGDPKVMKLAKDLQQDVVVQKRSWWLDKTEPAYEDVAAKVETTGALPQELRDARGFLVRDPLVPTADPEALVTAQERIKEQGADYDLLPVHQRRRWIEAARQGVTVDQVPVLPVNSEQELRELYTSNQIKWARASLTASGYVATPKSIEEVIKKHLAPSRLIRMER